jgi:hypothetical protein
MRTVAVYSDADAGAACRHGRRGGAHRPGAGAAESYLRGDRSSTRRGDRRGGDPSRLRLPLREPGFVEAVEAAGLTSSARPRRDPRHGLKDAAKALMEAAGVPVVPGYHGAEQDPGRCGRGRRDRLSGADQGARGRRRQGHAAGRAARGFRRCARSPRREARRLSATRRADREIRRPARATSRCRSSATRTAMSCICSSATARSSAATRR